MLSLKKFKLELMMDGCCLKLRYPFHVVHQIVDKII